MTTTTHTHHDKHRYRPDDDVQTPEWAGMSTIVGRILDREDYERHFGPVSGTGPLYIVNEGNTYCEAYQAVYSESELQPVADLALDATDCQP
jgi:hypothetical protein